VPELVKTFGIQAVPTFILFNEGIEVNRMTGGKTREQLEDFING
jgi:thioredoxin-like negative regulator of GroEL